MNASHSGAISAEHLEMEMRAARLFRILAIDTSRDGQVVFGMLDQNHVDDPRVRPDGFMSHFRDIPDQLRFSQLGQTGGHMTLDVGHVILILSD
jgi:hypothetical protein